MTTSHIVLRLFLLLFMQMEMKPSASLAFYSNSSLITLVWPLTSEPPLHALLHSPLM